MEKSFRNFFLMLMALSGTYTAFAQSKAIQVSPSSIEFYKQLKFNGDPIISVPAYGITIDLPQCDVHIKNDNGDYHLVDGISAVFEATDTIEISGNFVVKNGASLTLKAGGEVILGSDFKVEEGGELCIIVE